MEQQRQKDAMDVLQAWVDDYNARAGPGIRVGSAGEAGGAQLRLRYSPSEGQVSIFHMVAVSRNGRAAILVQRFDGPTAETAAQAWVAGTQGLVSFTPTCCPRTRVSIWARSAGTRAKRSRSIGWDRWWGTAASVGRRPSTPSTSLSQARWSTSGAWGGRRASRTT